MIHLGIQNLLFPYCPTIVNRIGRNSVYWIGINERYKKRIEFAYKEIQKNGSLDIEVTLFELVYQASKGDSIHTDFLTYIDKIVYFLSQNLPPHLQPGLTNIVFALIENFKNEEVSSNYLNAIGELGFLHMVLNLPNKPFELVDIELKLPNGQHADCHLRSRITGNPIYIDVSNMRVKPNKLKTDKDVEAFLSYRIAKKLKNKLKGLEGTSYETSFSIAPILWCDLKEMKKFQSFFARYPEYTKGVPCLTLGQGRGEKDTYIFEFHTLRSLLDRLDE